MVICVIVLTGISVGLETYDSLMQDPTFGRFLRAMQLLIPIVFTTEFVLKIIAAGLRPLSYFDSAWTCFDFVVLFFTLVPIKQLPLLILIAASCPPPHFPCFRRETSGSPAKLKF